MYSPKNFYDLIGILLKGFLKSITQELDMWHILDLIGSFYSEYFGLRVNVTFTNSLLQTISQIILIAAQPLRWPISISLIWRT